MAMRTTQHNGRTGANGSYSPKHMDRNTNTKKPTWDPEKSQNNIYWNCYDGTYTGAQKAEKDIQSIEQAERRFYYERYQKALDLQNANAKKNKNKQHDMEHFRKSAKTCPEEQLIYIGNKDAHPRPEVLWNRAIAQIKWEMEHYPVRYISLALHVDENGAPHIHARRVWEYTNEQGIKCINQKKALEQAGIKRPDPQKPESRKNNAKMTYTQECRSHFQELCKEYCFEIETNPKDRSEVGLSLLEYQARQEEQKIKELQQKQEIEQLEHEQQQLRNQQQLDIMKAEAEQATRDKEKAEAAKQQAIKDSEIIKAEADEAVIIKNQAEIDKQKADIEISKKHEKIEKQVEIINKNKEIIDKQANQYYAFKGIISQVNDNPKSFMEAHEHHFRDKDNITVNRSNYYRTESLVTDLHKSMSQLSQALKTAPAEYAKLQQEKPKIEAEKAQLAKDKANLEKEKSTYHRTLENAVKDQTEKEVAEITNTLNTKALAKFGISPEQYNEALEIVKRERSRGIER